jgi:hypothetical protein
MNIEDRFFLLFPITVPFFALVAFKNQRPIPPMQVKGLMSKTSEG